MNIGLLLLRLAVGLTLSAHGAQKLFGWFGGPGLERTGQGLERLGFHPGSRHALMAGLAELAGGLLMAFGFLTPVGAVITSSVMLVAAVTAHVRNGFFITSGGYEYNFVLGAAALSVAFTGPGALSIDAMLGYAVGGPMWGLGALVASVLAAAVPLSQRRMAHAPITTAA